MARRRRLIIVSLAVATVVAVVGGWAWARSDDSADSNDGTISTFPPPDATVDQPGIATNAPVQGEPFPEVDLIGPDGTSVPTSGLVGRPMVVNVWYSTCPPCRRELPEFATVAGELGDQVDFVGINPRDGDDVTRSFAEELGITYPSYRDPDGAFLAAAGIGTFPSTLFVAADGTIVVQHAGELTGDELRRIIDEELLG